MARRNARDWQIGMHDLVKIFDFLALKPSGFTILFSCLHNANDERRGADRLLVLLSAIQVEVLCKNFSGR